MSPAPEDPDDVRDGVDATPGAVDDPAMPTERMETAAFRGRASARVQPNGGRLLDDSSELPTGTIGGDQDTFGFPPVHSRAPLLVGTLIAALIAVAVFAIIRLSTVDRCPDAGCSAGPTRSTVGSAGVHPTTEPTIDPAVPAAIGPSAAAPLTAVMPADVDLATCRTSDDDPFLADVRSYYACKADAQADLPYLQVWGYQFGDPSAYRTGVDTFNAFVKLDPGSAEATCPPETTYGSVTWHASATPDKTAGTLECYSDSSDNHYYVWTDDTEYTILVAESLPEQTFAALDAWWRANNRNA